MNQDTPNTPSSTPPPPPSAAAPPPSTHGGTPPGAPPQNKKGLSPLAWVAIGCGAILFIGLVALLAGGIFVGGKVKQFAEETAENPAAASAAVAKGLIRLNPDLEIVDEDEESVTIRDTRTGETTTVDWSEAAEGRFRFGKDGEDTEVTFSEEEGITATGPEGERMRIGGRGGEDIPDWVPRYGDAEPAGTFTSQARGLTSGLFSLEADGDLDDVVEFYTEELQDAGFEIETSTIDAGGMRMRQLQGTSEGRQVSVQITETEGGRVQVGTQFEETEPQG